MTDVGSSDKPHQPELNLTPEEKRVFGQLFAQADSDKLGVVTGEVAVKFFERTRLAPQILGEIWQIADTENRGLLTSYGFCQVLRLIGHYQAGRDPSPKLAFQPGPLPRFDGVPAGQPVAPAPPAAGLQPQLSGNAPIRVPPLSPEKASEYAGLFEKSGAQNGILTGDTAKQIFEKAKLPNETLGRIWFLADTEQRGALGATEFIIAMHLIASFKNGSLKQLPNTLPAGLYEAAARRAPLPSARLSGERPRGAADFIPRQFSGSPAQRTQSPLARPAFNAAAQPAGNDWAITPQEKSSYDTLFSRVDTRQQGFITGEQAVGFFSDSGLPEETLASIWDLADINSEGQLTKDEFAVAMHLIRQQRKPGSVVPQSLPPSLIPPSMRNQPRPANQPTAPTFNNAAYSSNLPKSAQEDLFGLDALTSPAPVPQQSTGGSQPYNKPFEADPFGSSAASPTSPQARGFESSPRLQQSTSSFKPFVPTSSFGQGLQTQGTGGSAGAPTNRGIGGQQTSQHDDLLGDNDPEVSKKLTQETSELANMSNQIGTLRNQMQEVQNTKSVTERDLNSTSTQKRDLELRLSQFRSQYEQEVKTVKQLEERLNASRTETRKMQQDIAMLEGAYQDLQTQHRQVSEALQSDQRENASIKERIRQVNAEIGQLKPQLEKMRMDARQTKGRNTIDKKQLATNEGERDRMRGEMDDLTRSAQESSRSVEPTPQVASSVVSPAPSTSSNTNPFFRKPSQQEPAMSPSGFNREVPAPQQAVHKDFDTFFGPTATSPQSSQPPPQVSFRHDAPSESVRSSEGPDMPTPSTSPPLSSYHESPRTNEPPAPPESRQFGSGLLPLREGVTRTDSVGSSVKVSAPASRYGDNGAETPTASTPASKAPERTDTARSDTRDFSGPFDRNRAASPAASAASAGPFGSTASTREIPGAFPEDRATPLQQEPTGGSTFSAGTSGTRSDPFAFSKDQRTGTGSSKVDFDSAFAGFGSNKPSEKQPVGPVNGAGEGGSRLNKEFPPIENLAHDDDSDDSDTGGFEDNFTSSSPQLSRSAQKEPVRSTTGSSSIYDDAFSQRPSVTETKSGLPPITAQQSPPSYEQTTHSNERSGSNQFPAEYTDLLPARTDPTISPAPNTDRGIPGAGGSSTLQGSTMNMFGPQSSKGTSTEPTASFTSSPPPPTDTPSSTVPSDAYHSAPSHPSTDDKSPIGGSSQPSKPSFGDDFDSGFDDLDEAKEADERADDDFIGSHHREGLDEFNPTFDSPAASKSNTMASQQTPTNRSGAIDDSFGDFEHSVQGFSSSQKAPQQPAASASHDWDAIFSGLDKPPASEGVAQGLAGNSSSIEKTGTGFSEPHASSGAPESSTLQTAQGSSSGKQPADNMPQLGRALSAGTEHDDPILKKLTGMGYARNDALTALEKYDYDINKAADYLTSSH